MRRYPLWRTDSQGVAYRAAIVAGRLRTAHARSEHTLAKVGREVSRPNHSAGRPPVSHSEHDFVSASRQLHGEIARDVARAIPRSCSRAGLAQPLPVDEDLVVIPHGFAAERERS